MQTLLSGSGVDFLEQLRDKLDTQLGSTLSPFNADLPMTTSLPSPLSARLPAPSSTGGGKQDFQHIFRSNTVTEIPSITRKVNFKATRVDRFPNGRVTEQSWEASLEDHAQVYRSMRDSLSLAGNSVLERLLADR